MPSHLESRIRAIAKERNLKHGKLGVETYSSIIAILFQPFPTRPFPNSQTIAYSNLLENMSIDTLRQIINLAVDEPKKYQIYCAELQRLHIEIRARIRKRSSE